MRARKVTRARQVFNCSIADHVIDIASVEQRLRMEREHGRVRLRKFCFIQERPKQGHGSRTRIAQRLRTLRWSVWPMVVDAPRGAIVQVVPARG